MANESPATQTSHLNQSNEGTHVTGNVTTGGGDFMGRDKIVDGDEVHGDKVYGDKVTGHKITYEQITPRTIDAATLKAATAKLAKLPLNRIPPVAPLPTGSRMPLSSNPLFVGREDDLRTLAAALKGGETLAIGQITAATGLGGIGKTQLAVAFVHHYGQYFAGGVYWLNFADPNAIPAEIANCGIIMPDVRTDFATLDLETQVRLVLAAWQSSLPRLLVFDNCEKPTLLAQWRPPTGGSRILVTSRRHTWDAVLSVSVLELDTLARPDSMALLRKFRHDLLPNDPDLDQIALALGDLPLALHLAGSYLARYRLAVSPAHYLAQLRQPDLLQHRSLQAGDLSPTGHVQHVARTFALSYERLHPADPVAALARTLLARAAWFAPGQLIPRSLLLDTLVLKEESALQAEDALQRLTNLGLLEMEAEGNLLMHRLVMHFVQQADKEATQVAQNAVALVLLTEATRLNNTGVPGPLLAWQSHLRHITDAVQGQDDEQVAGLYNALGDHLEMIGEYAAAKPYYERALAINETVLGQEHPGTADSYANLGMLLKSMGDYVTAKPYYERALAIREAVLGLEHPDTAYSYNNLGMLLKAMGDRSAAKPYYERALAIKEMVLGQEHPSTALSYNNLGSLLQDMGELSAAKPYIERALAIRETMLGQGHPDTASSYNNLGSLLQKMGELSAAQPYFERALAIYEATLGQGHPDTARSYSNLGRLLRDMGDYAAAKPYIERALAIREAVFGREHPDTARSYSNLGRLLQNMGDYAAAKLYFERALAICEKSLGPTHPSTEIVRSSLIALQQSMQQK